MAGAQPGLQMAGARELFLPAGSRLAGGGELREARGRVGECGLAQARVEHTFSWRDFLGWWRPRKPRLSSGQRWPPCSTGLLCMSLTSLMATPDTGQGTLLPLWPSEARPFWWARHPESEVTC